MSSEKESAGKLWGGRFSKATDARTEAFTESISFDWALHRHDIAGSMAHATMLAEVGLITREDLKSYTAIRRAPGNSTRPLLTCINRPRRRWASAHHANGAITPSTTDGSA